MDGPRGTRAEITHANAGTVAAVDPDDLEGSWLQRRQLVLLAAAELLALSLWFSATAVVPVLQSDWNLTAAGAAWLTMSVQIGFVVGTFVSGFTNLPDLISSRWLFAVSAMLGALANALFAFAADGLAIGILLRLLTGVFLAGVYPPGMKLAATWTRRHRGVAIGLIVGALTVGSASPHLVRSLFDGPWEYVVVVSSGLATLGGVMVWLAVREGPFAVAGAKFEPRFIVQILRARGTRLANFGYFGHQWELYAMWTWVPIFLVQSFAARGLPTAAASGVAFAVVAVGGLGSLVAGVMADRLGRTAVTSAAMVASGVSALLAAALLNAPLWILLPLLLFWGFTVVADSAQFSTAVTELSPPAYLGTALTLQTAMGFLLTLFTIQLVPLLVEHAGGWPVAFIVLALGPVFGVAAMLRLRALPEAAALAGGRR